MGRVGGKQEACGEREGEGERPEYGAAVTFEYIGATCKSTGDV